MVTADPREVHVHVKLRGGNWSAFKATDPEVLVEGGTGTGKTIGILHRLNRHAQEFPGYHGAIVRKTAKSLADSVLTSFQDNVLHEWDKANRRSELDHVHFFGGSRSEPESYEYDNGSRIVVGGMDNPSKILGTEYDEVFVNQAEELSLEDWETLGGRLRHDVMPYRSLIGDCNPSYETHWLLQRAIHGGLRRIKTTLKDNPAYWDGEDWTELGREYLDRLEKMTGSRRQRFLLGEWVGMEGAIYADYLDDSMLTSVPENTRWTGHGHIGIDYGETPSHPSAVVAITESMSGVWWVRKCWAEAGGSTDRIEDEVRAQKAQFGIRDVMTGPDVKPWAQKVGWRSADGASGSRSTRIGYVTDWLKHRMLRFDRDGEGMSELWAEMHMYRWLTVETDRETKDVPVRKGEDRVSAVEYAREADEERPATIRASTVNLGLSAAPSRSFNAGA